MPLPPLPPEHLARFATGVYLRLGLPQADAALLADSVVQADLWGNQSHGVLRTFCYAKRLQSGATRAARDFNLAVDAGAIAVMDGHDGVGQVVTARALRDAVARSGRRFTAARRRDPYLKRAAADFTASPKFAQACSMPDLRSSQASSLALLSSAMRACACFWCCFSFSISS